ncbi:MAG: hypothetical protein J6R92_07515, partial [Akkermansia sp.]|nr:hypothetical protein [Akkermansia sp.]
SSLLLSCLMLGLGVAEATQLYTITLSSSEQFKDCTVSYKSDETTKFEGIDKDGNKVTKEVPTADITAMREKVKEENSEAGKVGVEEAPAAEEEQQEPIADGNISQREGENKAKDATLRLREMMATLDSQMAKISKPSRSLVSQVNQAKRRVTAQLSDMDKRSLEVARLQDEFNEAGAADFTFDKVSVEQRTQYERDGKAAYKAMKIDMKERKGRRKVAGLDKFEILRENYQGIPEYREAYGWYVKTLYALEKKWSAMHKKENNLRQRLQSEKRSLRARQDEAQYKDIAAKLKEEGDDIAKVWFVPPTTNLKMLNISVNKVKDAIRRNEDRPLDKEVGTVPALLEEYWNKMDEARMAMITGNLEGAEQMLRDNKAYEHIVRLKTYLIPNEYRNPIIEQHREMEKEIRTRSRNYSNLKRQLERAIEALDRVTNAANAQLESAMSAVQKELDSDAGENTMEVEKEKTTQEAVKHPATDNNPAATNQPAAAPQK